MIVIVIVMLMIMMRKITIIKVYRLQRESFIKKNYLKYCFGLTLGTSASQSPYVGQYI